MLFSKKTYSELTDEKLIKKIVSGDHSAFTEIYKRYSERLLYYFYRMLGNSNDKAQDFLQDIFIKLIDKAIMFDESRKFSTWFFSIAHNMCKNEYRRCGTQLHTCIEPLSDTIPDTFPELTCEDSDIDPEMFSKDLFSELDSFDEIHKSVFLLHYREGFSLKDIALALEISEGTVKSRLFYTRRRLSEKLSKYNVKKEIL
jgi:RNA polymerase sigma-70 factor, ECF subfamily